MNTTGCLVCELDGYLCEIQEMMSGLMSGLMSGFDSGLHPDLVTLGNSGGVEQYFPMKLGMEEYVMYLVSYVAPVSPALKFRWDVSWLHVVTCNDST